MDKMFIRKDVYNELLEKGFGNKDYSKLTKKKITDKNGHTRTVFVRNGEQPAAQKQPKAQEGLTPEKKARYEEMLKKVMAGSDENALFVHGKMLNKKDAIAHLSEKLGIKVSNQSAEDFLHGSEPTPGKIMRNQQQQIMDANDNKVVIKRKYGMISLYGAKTGDHIADFQTEKARLDFMKENNLSKPDANTPSPDIKGGEKTIDRYKELYENKKKPTQDDMKSESTSIFNEEMEEDNTTAKTFEDAIKNYNFTDEKYNQFAMDEVAKFYPDLKETVDKHRKAFHDVDDAKRKLSINPNNKEYQENFKNAVNELSKMNKEYESKAAKALEKTPNIPKPSFEKYMDARRKVDKFKDTYKKQLEEFEVGERLRANGGAAILNPMYGLKPNDYTKDSDYINAQMTIRAFEGK